MLALFEKFEINIKQTDNKMLTSDLLMLSEAGKETVFQSSSSSQSSASKQVEQEKDVHDSSLKP